MSFCFLLNAVLLFGGVISFIIAGFAGTFSRRMHAFRYRLMLAPLGFVVLGSISYSTTTHLIAWFVQANPIMHFSHVAHRGLGSGPDMFESAVLVLAGFAGLLTGIALGAALDRAPAGDQTFTIANYWDRQAGRKPATAATEARPAHKAKVISITGHLKQTSLTPQSTSQRNKALSENE